MEKALEKWIISLIPGKKLIHCSLSALKSALKQDYKTLVNHFLLISIFHFNTLTGFSTTVLLGLV